MANTYSLSLNGSSQSISTASSLNLSGTNAVTVEFWAKIAYPTTGTEVILELSTDYNGVTTGFIVPIFADVANDPIQVALKGDVGYNDANYITGTTGVNDGNWHHFGCIFDKSETTNEVDLYIDASLKTADSRSSTSNNTNNFGDLTLYIGSRNNSSLWCEMLIDDVRVWTDRRTTQEIQDNYRKELVGNEAGLLAYWKLESDYEDTTTNNEDLSATGVPSFSTDVPTWAILKDIIQPGIIAIPR